MTDSRARNINWGSFALSETVLDDDPSVVIQSLLVGATQENDVEAALSHVHEVVVSNNIASDIDALAAVPLLLPLPFRAATELLNLISSECSAKELIIAVQEGSESLRRRLLDGEEESDEQTNEANKTKKVAIAVQSTRLLKVCSHAIIRLRKGKMSEKDTLEPLLAEMKSLLYENARSIGQADAQPLLLGTIDVIGSTVVWAKDQLANGLDDILYDFVRDVLKVYANHTAVCIAERTFSKMFPQLARLVAPPSIPEADAAAEAWRILGQAGISINTIKDNPSVGHLILLVHSGTQISIPLLQTFLPVVITCIRTNTAVEEALSLIMLALPGRRFPFPPPLTPDLSTVLTHLLSQLASLHPDSTLRHITFRVLGHALWLTPAPLRMQLLADLLSDVDTPEQMHVSGIALVKESVLESFGQPPPTPNNFASPEFVSIMGPVLFRPRLPATEDAEDSLEQFLLSPEPSRLVEVFGLLFILLERDVTNSTGMRTKESLQALRKELLQPVHERLGNWNTIDLEDAEDARVQLGILDMWVERVSNRVNQMLEAEGGV